MSTTGYILHRRNYRESSLLLDVLTQEQGRLSILCKGVKKKKAINYCLRPFTRLNFELVEFSDLAILQDAETLGSTFALQDNQLIAGMYLNELLCRLLERHEAVPAVFQLYEDTLEAISFHKVFAQYVRQFEYHLLCELGYGFQLRIDCKENAIDAESFYQFLPSEGFAQVNNYLQRQDVFQGAEILAMANWDLATPVLQKACKRLLFIALKPLIGDRPLMSTELLKQKQALLAGVVQ
jgi:DNA repair protein RecO (recombination protein O)